jgi:hypothetical protein
MPEKVAIVWNERVTSKEYLPVFEIGDKRLALEAAC